MNGDHGLLISGSKSKSEQVAKGKDMISEACRVRIVFLDSQIGFVVKKAIKNMRRIPYCGVDDLGMEGRILVRNVRVKGDPRIVSIFQVDLSCSLSATSRTISLSV